MTTPGMPVKVEDFPAWAREPVKLVGWAITTVLVVAAGITVLLAQFEWLIPEKYKTAARTIAATVATVTLIAGRIQTWLSRNGFGPAGNGKDGVYSPAGALVMAQNTAIEVAAAKAVDPATHAQ